MYPSSLVTIGYLHGSGDYAQFIIKMNDGYTIAVRDKAEIQQTLDYWRSTAASPLKPELSKVPADILQWMDNQTLAIAKWNGVLPSVNSGVVPFLSVDGAVAK